MVLTLCRELNEFLIVNIALLNATMSIVLNHKCSLQILALSPLFPLNFILLHEMLIVTTQYYAYSFLIYIFPARL